jgi:hypothetical protein
MKSEKSESSPDSSKGRAVKIRVPPATVLKELNELASTGPVRQEALEVELPRIAQEKVSLHGCGFIVPRLDDGITSFVMKVRGGEIRIRSRLEFLPTLRPINSENGSMTYDPRS